MIRDTFQKLPEESVLEFIYRVCDEKDTYQLTWPQIAEILNSALSQNYSESFYRKGYLYNQFPAKLIEVSNLKKSPDPADIDEDLLELKKERVKLSDERSQVMGAIRRLAREDTLLEIAEEAARILRDKPILPNYQYLKVAGENQAILQLSDWHYGIEIKNTWNEYNPQIAKDRIIKLKSKVIDVIRNNKISTLYIANLGDLISGRIHETIRIQNRIDVITQSLEVAEILARLICELSQYCSVKYISCSDNHSRLEPKKESSLDLESLTRVIDPLLELRIKNAQLKNECGDVEFLNSPYGHDIATFTVFDYQVGAVHGHKDSPKNIVSNLSLMTQKHFNLILSAHLHHFNCDEQNNTLVISNGSLMGVDDYAETLRLTNKPSQNLIIVSNECIAEAIYRIELN